MRKWMGLAAVPLVLSGMIGSAVEAGAASPIVTDSGKYCAYYAPTGKLACVADQNDFAAAKAAAFQTDSGTSAVAAGQYAMGVFYDNANFDASAGTITWFDSHDCTTARTNVDSGWSNTGVWMNRISSFKGQSNCWIRPWALTNYQGATLSGYVSQAGTLNALNDKVNSVQFS